MEDLSAAVETKASPISHKTAEPRDEWESKGGRIKEKDDHE